MTISMHRFILEVERGVKIDHKSRNSLDNRRGNLRMATTGQNRMNTPSYCGNSRYKGVSWLESNKGWRALIQKNKKNFYLGTYKTQKEAARAYDKAAQRLFGEYAYSNFPKEVCHGAE